MIRIDSIDTGVDHWSPYLAPQYRAHIDLICGDMSDVALVQRFCERSSEVDATIRNAVRGKVPSAVRSGGIKRVIFNDPATIVFWRDGTKTVVKCQEGDIYSKELGLAMCIAKKAYGNHGNYNNVFKAWIPETDNPMFEEIELTDAQVETISEQIAKAIDTIKSAVFGNEGNTNE